ncbi:MAG: hypothetical protein M3H12_06450, partial [Chromatiales bacterium]
WAAADLVDTIKARQMLADGKPKAFFVISRAIKNTTLGREITEALADYDISQFVAGTTQRQIYARAAVGGQAVHDDTLVRLISSWTRLGLDCISFELQNSVTHNNRRTHHGSHFNAARSCGRRVEG